MNNYQKSTIQEVLKDVTIRCIKCHSNMVRFDYKYLEKDAVVGYRCENCPHYYLLDNDPV